MTYLLQLNDIYRQFFWEITLLSSEPEYVRKKPQYKFLTTNVHIDYETNMIQLMFNSDNNNESIVLNRNVMVEKIDYKISQVSNEPIIDWVYQQLFSSSHFSNLKNFHLMKLDDDGKVIKSWLLKECALIDSTIWRNGNKKMVNETITIKPNIILQ